VLVVVPTYNERENLPPLVRQVLAHDGFRMMIVDDGSPDGTGAVADRLVNWPLHRIFLSTFANNYIRAVTRLTPRDCTSGFRCWRREALGRLPLAGMVSDGYAFLVEMLYEATRHGCRIGEVPIIFVERAQGHSKVSTPVLLESLVIPWRLVLRRSR
jgi:dolichol-phosphate mannosyltransferase